MVLYGARLSGTYNCPPDGGVLLVSNHQSHYDPPLVACCCPRRVNTLAKKDLFNFTPFGWYIRSLGAFPVDREGSALGGVRETLRRLKKGEVVVMFPEGMRCLDGEICEFMNGFTMIATRSKAAILPMAIEGPFQAWPPTRNLPRLGPRMHVAFGKAIMPEEMSQYTEDELAAEVERRIRECHRGLLKHPDNAGRSR